MTPIHNTATYFDKWTGHWYFTLFTHLASWAFPASWSSPSGDCQRLEGSLQEIPVLDLQKEVVDLQMEVVDLQTEVVDLQMEVVVHQMEVVVHQMVGVVHQMVGEGHQKGDVGPQKGV